MRAEPIAGRYELVEPIKAGGMGQVYDDALLVYGPDHEEAQEIAGIPARLRIVGDAPTALPE